MKLAENFLKLHIVLLGQTVTFELSVCAVLLTVDSACAAGMILLICYSVLHF